jgi:hypothetical protein
VQVPGIEEEVVTDANEVVMPEYGEREWNEPDYRTSEYVEPIAETTEGIRGYVDINNDAALAGEQEILQEIPQQEVTAGLLEQEMPVTFEEYQSLSIESRLELQGVYADINDDDVFRIVKENFDKAGYAADFDELYEEAAAIQKHLKAKQYSGSVEEIVRKLQKYGSYDSIPLSVKADVFSFGFNNASENLDIYMEVLKQLGVKMDQSEMFEDYQAIYEETVKRQEKEVDKGDKRWNREKIR